MIYFIVDTIFISIAACKEEFLVQTIKSAISNSDMPEMLYFGISNMVIDSIDFVSDPIFDEPKIKCLQISFSEALGTGFGRMTASFMADKEHTYILQVDAQNIFEKGWDTELKKYYKDLLKVCDKPIISNCPTRWVEGPNKEVCLYEEDGPRVDPYNFKTTQIFSSLGVKIYDRGSKDNDGTFERYAAIEGVHHDWKDEQTFVEHGLIHASFMFTSFSFIHDVMHDPQNPWDGDQINLSFRAGTRGYRMFAIKNCIVWSKDKFNRDGKLVSSYDWRNTMRGSISLYNEKKSRDFQRKIFSGEYLGYWGAPTKESIDTYYKSLGIDLSKYFI
jgi:hypothetical protein